MAKRVWPIASNEDGVEWYERCRASRLRARLENARLIGEPLWLLDVFTLDVDLEHMRPARCPIVSHADNYQGGEDDPPELCDCYHAEEGWHYVCEADHPEAIAVWRVEWARGLPRVVDALRMRLSRRRMRYRPVLWGASSRRYNRRAQLRLGENRVQAHQQWTARMGGAR